MIKVVRVNLEAMSLRELEHLKIDIKHSGALNKDEALKTVTDEIKSREIKKVRVKETEASKKLDQWILENGIQSSILVNRSASIGGIGGPKGLNVITAKDMFEALTEFHPNTPIFWEQQDLDDYSKNGNYRDGGIISSIRRVVLTDDIIEAGQCRYVENQILIQVGSLI